MSADTSAGREAVTLADIERCFGGAIPAVLATASSDGVVNVTYISRAHQVDEQRVALSNQFMSKTSRNLTSNPRASLLLLDPVTHDEYRLALVYERTERRGPVFERLRNDIDALAVLENMQDVYRLRAADIFRVVSIEQFVPNPSGRLPAPETSERPAAPAMTGLAELAGCIARASDLDVLVETALEGLDRLLGYRHTMLLLLDEEGRQLYAIGSRGFDEDGIGAEVLVGEGQTGLAAERCEPLRIGGLHPMKKYAWAIRQGYEQNDIGPGHVLPLPVIAGVQSRIVVPAMARGELVGVLVAESPQPVAFGSIDEQTLCVVGGLLASAVEHVRAVERDPLDDPDAGDDAPMLPTGATNHTDPAGNTGDADTSGRHGTPVEPGPTFRFFPVDGSVFVDGDYLIKGVAGRILWSLLSQRADSGREDFTNRELRLDPSLQLPGFKDNLESRLILLKRRLDEREIPVRLERTGRGRFRVAVSAEPRLESVST